LIVENTKAKRCNSPIVAQVGAISEMAAPNLAKRQQIPQAMSLPKITIIDPGRSTLNTDEAQVAVYVTGRHTARDGNVAPASQKDMGRRNLGCGQWYLQRS
jgi:hypothetical protein